MSYWQQDYITNIYTGAKPNDGTGDDIRDAFIKVDNNFGNIASFIQGENPGFLNATIAFNLNTQYANISNLFVANATGTISSFTGNSTSGNVIANTSVHSLGQTFLVGDTVAGNVSVSGNLDLFGTTIVRNTFVPSVDLTYDLGSPSKQFRKIYAQELVTTTQSTVSSDAGILVLHANVLPGDIKDVGILGKFNKNSSNSYAYFGYQYNTNNFVYKITPTNATSGNSVVYDGVYGNAQLGSLFLSNTTSTSANTLIVAGDINSVGNVYITGNLYSSANAFFNTANVQTLGVSGNLLGNLSVTGTIYSAGSPLLSVNTAGPYNMFSGGIVLGNVLLASTFDASTQTNAAMVVTGGIGVGANVNAGGLVGPYYGTIQTAAQPNITTVGSLGNLTVINRIQASSLQATTLGVTAITATSINTGDITIGGATIVGGGAGSISAGTIGNVTSVVLANTITATTLTAGTVNANTNGAVGSFTVVNATNLNAPTVGNVGTALIGLLSNSAQTNITSLGNLISLNVVGNVTSPAIIGTLYGNSIGATATYTGNVNAAGAIITGNITSGNISSTRGTFTNMSGTILTAAQPNINSIGSAGLSIGGNTSVASSIYAQGVYDNSRRVLSTTTEPGNLTISGTSVSLSLIGPGAVGAGSATDIPRVQVDQYGRVTSLSTQPVSTTFGVVGTSGTSSVTSAGATVGVLSLTGAYGMTAVATVANSTSTTVNISTPQDLRTTASPVFSGLIPAANVAYNIGSSSLWWASIYGEAIHALYADLAEKYESDAEYDPGTVVIFGGEKEITTTMEQGDERVAGVISTNPAYLMNAEADGLPVALRGRVPVKVYGPVRKGDSLVTSAIPGVAISVGRDRTYGQAVFAKAIETDISNELKTITAVIL